MSHTNASWLVKLATLTNAVYSVVDIFGHQILTSRLVLRVPKLRVHVGRVLQVTVARGAAVPAAGLTAGAGDQSSSLTSLPSLQILRLAALHQQLTRVEGGVEGVNLHVDMALGLLGHGRGQTTRGLLLQSCHVSDTCMRIPMHGSPHVQLARPCPDLGARYATLQRATKVDVEVGGAVAWSLTGHTVMGGQGGSAQNLKIFKKIISWKWKSKSLKFFWNIRTF